MSTDRHSIARQTVVGMLLLPLLVAGCRMQLPATPNLFVDAASAEDADDGLLNFHDALALDVNHDEEFTRNTHGLVARSNRTGCLSCHRAESCEACHSRTPPAWHDLDMVSPDRGQGSWREHAREAAARNHGPTTDPVSVLHPSASAWKIRSGRARERRARGTDDWPREWRPRPP